MTDRGEKGKNKKRGALFWFFRSEAPFFPVGQVRLAVGAGSGLDLAHGPVGATVTESAGALGVPLAEDVAAAPRYRVEGEDVIEVDAGMVWCRALGAAIVVATREGGEARGEAPT